MLDTHSDESSPAGPSHRSFLIRARHIFLALYLFGVCAGIWDLWFSDNSLLLKGGHLDRQWKPILIIAAIYLVVPTLFLSGAPHLRWPRATRGRWIGITMTLGALWAALISTGIGAALFSLFFPDKKLDDVFGSFGISTLGLLAIIAVPWTGWLLFFSVVWAGEWIVVFRRLYRLLLAGTCLELLITIPIDAHVRNRSKCYCGEGSLLALIIGTTMAFWTFGPGIFLLYLTRRTQRMDTGLCAGCGYDLRGSSGSRCPECGKIIRRGSIAPKIS